VPDVKHRVGKKAMAQHLDVVKPLGVVAIGEIAVLATIQLIPEEYHRAPLPLRVRGLERVQLHADLTILAKLSCALARARAAPSVTTRTA